MAAVMNFGGDVELGVIVIAVEIETAVAYDVTKGKHVREKEEGGQALSLGGQGLCQRRSSQVQQVSCYTARPAAAQPYHYLFIYLHCIHHSFPEGLLRGGNSKISASNYLQSRLCNIFLLNPRYLLWGGGGLI